MTNVVRRARRVVVSLAPRLLSDSLVTLLAGHGLDVATTDAAGDGRDVVLVTDDTADAGATTRADVVVQLTTGADGVATAVVHTWRAGPSVRIEGLPAILRVVSQLCVGGHQDRLGEG